MEEMGYAVSWTWSGARMAPRPKAGASVVVTLDDQGNVTEGTE